MNNRINALASGICGFTAVACLIPAQGLGSALQQLAKDRDVQLVYRSEVVGDRQTSGAAGELTVDEALTKLLAGTGLTYQYIDDQAITIVPMDSRSSRQASGLRPQASSDGVWGRFRLAQAETTAAPSQGGRSTEDSQRRVTLEEIIVTAQKRKENILDVPLSITAVTAEDIDQRGLFNAGDYLRGIPSVNQTDSPNGQSIIIRGIETSPQAQSFGPGITYATYFGETPTTSSAGLGGGTNVDIKLVDIERVEVLRGPQGTSYGSASLGGAVRTIPVAPKVDRTEIKLGLGYSVTSGYGDDNSNVQAIGNVPLIKDRLAVRATAYQYEDSGYYRNRAALTVVPPGATALPDEDDVGATWAAGGRIAALLQATDDLRITLSYLTQETEMDGLPVATSGTYQQSISQGPPEHAVRGRRGGIFDTNIDIANAMLEYDLGWGDLLATYSHIKSGSLRSAPVVAIGNSLAISQMIPSDHKEDSGEIRLATNFDGAWNFLAGLYADDITDDVIFSGLWYGSPATNPFLPGTPYIPFASGLVDRVKQKAAFSEVSWNFLPAFTLTGGVRVFDYERSRAGKPTSEVLGLPPGTPVGPTLSTDQSDESFRANLSYQPNDNTHIYVGWGQGFRIGKPGSGLNFPSTCDGNGDGLVDGTGISMSAAGADIESDRLDNYELGSKLSLLDRRLSISAAVFHMDWTDLPITLRAGELAAGCGLTYLANAGEAISEGIEFQASYQISEPLRVDFGASYTDARLTKDVPAQNLFEDDRLPGSPKHNANLGLQYEFRIGTYEAFVRADSIYVGEFYGNPQQSPNTKAGEYIKVNTSARVSIRSLDVDLFVDNLTNEDAFTFRGVAGGVGPLYGYRLRPRTFGIRLAYSFN